MANVGDPILATDLAPLADTAFTPWTPTLTNLNLGTTGSADCRYKEIGRLIKCIVYFTFGGTGISVGGSPYFSLPTGITPAANQRCIGDCSYTIGGTRYFGKLMQSGVSVLFYRTAETATVITSTAPGTFAAGSIIEGDIDYEST